MSKDQEYIREFMGELMDNLLETKVALSNLTKQSEKFSNELNRKRDGGYADLSRLERKSLALLDLWMTLQQEVKESGQIMGDIRRLTSQRQKVAHGEKSAKELLKEVRELMGKE